ncbi:YIP1 family protein [Ovoidimarina sediminis]|uniref:YIP1 family protein n=1 Tax=Ovoidimarina sediminis TaxID=3079856 RepID=UPI00290C19AD|nr:YIP1 family protein [Rhodophyticola sp. MJ-SS7]MDU8945603.1 YIP1 family protein [Rhodophyticola sp. MJ-SS7]
MSLSFSELMRMVLRTLQNPREGAAEVLALGIPREAHWLLVAVVVVLSSLLTEFFAVVAMMGSPASAMGQPSLVLTLAVHLGSIVMLIVLVQGIGRAMGGTGRVEETTVLMCWLQFVMMVVSVAQTLLILLMPPIAAVVLFAGVGILLWLLTHFVAVLHGFRSLAGVFGMILGTAFLIAVVLTILLQMAGVEFPMPEGAV